MNTHEPQSIPQTFLDQHYCQEHVMHSLEMTEPEFWAAYVAGAIPRGVSLMALTGVPLIVWPVHVLDEWVRNGKPPEPGALELQNEVLHALLDAYRAEGCVFPDEQAELN